MQTSTQNNKKQQKLVEPTLKYKLHFSKGTIKRLQTKHHPKKNDPSPNTNIFQLVKKNIKPTIEADMLEVLSKQKKFKPLDILNICNQFLEEKHPKLLKKLKAKKKWDEVETVSKVIQLIQNNSIDIEITDEQISFIEKSEIDFLFGYFLYVDYLDKIKNPILKKAYANIILRFSNFLENHLNLVTPIEEAVQYQEEIECFVDMNSTELEHEDEEEKKEGLLNIASANENIKYYQDQLKDLKDENWYNLLTQYTPTNDTDSTLKQICIKSSQIDGKAIFNLPFIDTDSEDYQLHYHELFRILLVGEELEFERQIIQSLDERVNNYGITIPQIITTYNKKQKLTETSNQEIQNFSEMMKYINELTTELNAL